jgi:transposase InsO family protein
MAAGFTWVIHGQEGEDKIFATEARPLVSEADLTSQHAILDSLSAPSPCQDTDDGNSERGTDAKSKVSASTLSNWIAEQAADEERLMAESKHAVKDKDGLLLHAPAGEIARLIVPVGRRTALTMAAHERIMHRGWRKTLSDLKGTFFWKSMNKDVKDFVTQLCKKCFLAKRKRNLAHGQFSSRETSGPRLVWLLDYVKMPQSEAGHNYWLTAMDLFTHLLLLTPAKTRSAEEACTLILNRIIFRFGVPKFFVSDDEKAFLSALLRGLEDLLGINHIASSAYNSTAIAALERAHLYLGECLRLLPKDQRGVWDTFGPRFEHGFNTVVCDTTSFTPFELDSGMPARTVTSVVAMRDTKRFDIDSNKAVGVYGRIRDAAKLYQDLAIEATKRAKQDQNDRLNRSRTAPKEYKVGQKVAVYMPGRLDADWRPKHSLRWAGPMVVTRREGQSIYTVREIATEKHFRRHVSNICAYPVGNLANGDDHGASIGGKRQLTQNGSTAAQQDEAVTSGFVLGNVVAFFDDESKTAYWLGDVVRLEGDDAATIHMRATTSTKVKSARFLPVHVETPSGLSILAINPKRRLSPGCTAAPWTGVVQAQDVINFDVQLTSQHRLSAASRRSLKTFKHVIMD